MAYKTVQRQNTIENDSSVVLLLSVSGIPDEVDEDDIKHSFSRKKCVCSEVKVLNYEESNRTAVVSVKLLDKKKGM